MLTTDFFAEEWYSEHSSVCRRRELTRQDVKLKQKMSDVTLEEFMCLLFPRTSRDIYLRRFRSLLIVSLVV